ncbi:MAG TPA: ferredoxin family protein [Pirellulales bacterium]|nr:ferredoxin family protein [Pirellulales bacterium]
MMVTVVAPLRIVIYEGRNSESLDDTTRFEVLRRLLGQGHRVTHVPCGERFEITTQERLVVVGRFSSSMPAELQATDAASHVRLLSIAGLDAEQIVRAVETAKAELSVGNRPAWKPWFPVIDYDRCTNCMQCLSFCLFDVYGVSGEAKIQVQHQANCKTDCPACSRVCPEVAILFPKYKAGPINGAEIDADDLRREAMKVDISALLGGDIYAMLRDRSARASSRFSKERDDERALKERQRCLDKMQQQMEIPAEVLSALPSIEQIQAKAEQAKARAEAALRDAAKKPG